MQDDRERQRLDRDTASPASRMKRLRRDLHAFFPKHPIPAWPETGRVSLEALACRKHLRGKEWDRVDPDILLTTCNDCFLNLKSLQILAYYLPAFLNALLISYPQEWGGLLYLDVVGGLCSSSPDFDLQSEMTTAQSHLVGDFLDLVAGNADPWSEWTMEIRSAAERWSLP